MRRITGKVEPVKKIWLAKEVPMAYLGCSGDYLEKLRYNAQVSFAQDGRKMWYELQSINRFLNRKRVI